MMDVLALLALSAGRMLIAYLISLVLAYVLGYFMAREPVIERMLMPIIDVLQSIPILVFFPPVISIFINNIPGYGIEAAEIFLIIACMVWNMIFSVYESFTSLRQSLKDITVMFKVNEIDRFFKIYLPYISIGMVPNSMASWANGWFFLIATEIISVGKETYALRGIGSYIMQSAIQGDVLGIMTGIGLVSLLIVLMDIFIWRPLMNISSKYIKGKKELMIYDRILDFTPDAHIRINRAVGMASRFLDEHLADPMAGIMRSRALDRGFRLLKAATKYLIIASVFALVAALAYTIYSMGSLITLEDIAIVAGAFAHSLSRIMVAYLLCIAWIIPAVYLISRSGGYEANIIRWMEIVGSIPVSAIFPAAIIILTSVLGNFETVAIIFMMTGMQWYLFFNIYGAYKSMPEYVHDLKSMYSIGGPDFTRRIVMPFMMPFIILGSCAAIGGGWNTAIVAEYVSFGSSTFEAHGIGSMIHRALIEGDMKSMFLCTMVVAIAIPAINICFWRPMMKAASKKRGSLV